MNKKTIKKLTAFLCTAALLSFSFIGCSASDDKKDSGSSAAPSLSPTGGTEGTDASNGTGTDATSDANKDNGTTGGTGTSESPSSDAAGGSDITGPITGAKEGTYEASAKGYASDVKVTVTVDKDGVVKKIDVDAAGETENIGQAAAPQIADKVVETQSLSVDSVSGATYTSAAVMTAIKDALTQAGVDATAVTQ